MKKIVLFFAVVLSFFNNSSSQSLIPDMKFEPIYQKSLPSNSSNDYLSEQEKLLDRIEKLAINNYNNINKLISVINTTRGYKIDEGLKIDIDLIYSKLNNLIKRGDYENHTTEIDLSYRMYNEAINNFNIRCEQNILKARNLVVEYFKSGQYGQAIEVLSDLIGIFPNEHLLYYNRALAYYSIQSYSLSIIDFNKYIASQTDVNQKLEGAYFYRGYCKKMTKDIYGALTDFNKVLELNPISEDAFFERARVKSDLGDIIGSIADNNEVLKLNPKNSMAYNNRAWDKFKQNKLKEALDDVNMALLLDDSNYVAYDSRQEIKFALKDYKGCIEDCNKALLLNPKIANCFYFRGRASYRLGLKTSNCEDWSKAGELGKFEAYELIKQYCNK